MKKKEMSGWLLLAIGVLCSGCAATPAAVPALCEWIAPTVAMPKDEEQILVALHAMYKEREIVAVGPGMRRDGQWLIKNRSLKDGDAITHWMYYPKAPYVPAADDK